MWFMLCIESLQDSLWSFQLPVELIAEAFRSLKKVCGIPVKRAMSLFCFHCSSLDKILWSVGISVVLHTERVAYSAVGRV
jgi:hypothetical protein